MNKPKTSELLQELIDRVKTTQTFIEDPFSIFNLEEVREVAEFSSTPFVAISYDGMGVLSDEGSGQAISVCAGSVSVVDQRFLVTIGIEYRSGGTDDSKPIATDFLDSVRESIIGFQGVNSRPWVLVGEGPVATGIEGMIFYTQQWQTRVPIVGTFQKT